MANSLIPINGKDRSETSANESGVQTPAPENRLTTGMPFCSTQGCGSVGINMSLAGCNQHLPAFADPIFDTRTQFLTDDNLDYHTGIELSLAYVLPIARRV